MYLKNNKQYMEWKDFENSIEYYGKIINKLQNNDFYSGVHLVTLYRGGLPLGVRLSNEFNLPLTILNYQRLDGKDNKEISMGINAGIESDEIILIVDDIADHGISIKKAIDFISSEFPQNKQEICTIFGNPKHIHNKTNKWNFQHLHNGEWIVFPWEEKC